MNVIMVGPMDTKGRYPGGIAQVMMALQNSQHQFKENGISIEWFNNFRIQRSQYSNGKLMFQNFSNAFRTVVDLRSTVKKLCPDCIYYHGSVRLALLKDLLILKSTGNVKKIIHIHYADLDKILHKNPVLRTLTLRLLKTVPDHIVTLSKKTKEELVVCGISEKQISVIYNFHNLSFLEDSINKKICKTIKKEYLDLLYIGSIDERKGIIDLLYSLKKVNCKFKLHICGLPISEEVKQEVDRLIKELPEDTIVYHGFISGEDKNTILLDSDVLILPSYGEGFPLVLLEGIAAGCSIITTDVGAISEVFTEDYGAIIRPGDIRKLAQDIDAFSNKDILIRVIKHNYVQSKTYNIESFIHNVTSVCISICGY